jgi:hypothetical protein
LRPLIAIRMWLGIVRRTIVVVKNTVSFSSKYRYTTCEIVEGVEEAIVLHVSMGILIFRLTSKSFTLE